jgi:DNA repair protein RecO (recombination protein O)
MSELLKTEAIVLRKLDYGDSSRIIHFFTEEFGKLTAIIKGARSSKSKLGLILDSFNYVQIVLYKKETRDIQIVSDVDLLNHFGVIKEDFQRMQYASAIVELLSNLVSENEAHKKLFIGTVKALEILNHPLRDPKLFFTKYLIFFIKEIGYAISIDKCSQCETLINTNQTVGFNYDSGIICSDCKSDRLVHLELEKELFNLFICLNHKQNEIKYKQRDLDRIIRMLEKFLKYNIQEFKGLKSLELL